MQSTVDVSTVADAASRNAPDREQVRDEFTAKTHAPATLKEAFQRARDSISSIDDADSVINACMHIDTVQLQREAMHECLKEPFLGSMLF